MTGVDVPSGSLPITLEAKATGLLTGSPSMSARSMSVGPGPFITATKPVLPTLGDFEAELAHLRGELAACVPPASTARVREVAMQRHQLQHVCLDGVG
jgi:hypothetical protein